MSDPRPSTVPFVRSVRDQHGDRIMVGFAPPPDELTCDCTSCNAQLQGATTVIEDAEEVAQ